MYVYLSGTVVPNEESVSGDKDSLVIKLDATPNQGRFEGNELWVFEKLWGEDAFPFKPGDKVVEVLMTPEEYKKMVGEARCED